MPQVLPMTRVEAYLAYKAGVISEADLKPSLKTNFYSGLENWLAYWCGLTADYPKDENNDPKWYTEEEYYIAYLCGIAPDYPVNCYRRVGAYLRYIISARWEKPEKPLTREEYYLSLMSTTYLPANDPASVISIDNTAEAPFGDLKIYGDSFQQTYSGKNLMGGTLEEIKAWNTSGSWDGNKYTYRGVTYTFVFNGDLLDRVELSGTATKNGNVFLCSVDRSQFLNRFTIGSTYTLSGCPAGGSPTTYYLRVAERPWVNSFTDVGSGASHALSLSDSATRVDFSIGVDSGTITDGLVFRPQFELGSTATAYEPYVGGIPAPNPDYPQDVNVVTGNQTVKVTGKNIIDYAHRNTNKFWSDSGIMDNSGVYDCTDLIRIPTPTSSITLSREATSGYIKWGVAQFKSDGTFISRLTNPGSTESTWTASLDSNTAFVGINWRNDIASSGQIMAELGDQATDYVPYQGQSYEINLGKNLFDKTDPSLVFDGYLLSETITLIAQADNETIFIPCQPNTTYTVQKRFSTSGKNRFRIASFATLPTKGAVGTNLGGYSQTDADTHNTATYTTSADAKYLAVFCYKEDNNVTFAQMLDSIQIELGSTATTYAAYFTPIELVKIGDYQDYLWTDGEKWWKHKEIQKMTLEGSQAFVAHSTANNFYDNNIPNDGAYGDLGVTYKSSSRQPIAQVPYMTDFALATRGIDYAIAIKYGNGAAQLALRDIRFTSVADLNAWLAANPETFYYVIATPTDEEITDTTLISQLNALLEGGSYNYQTNIVVLAADPNLPGLLQVTAAKYQ